MIYVLNFAPGINVRLFSEWFLKQKFSHYHDGYTLKFDETGFNFKAFKKNQDCTNEYIFKYSSTFIDGLPKAIYNELNKIPIQIIDTREGDLFFKCTEEEDDKPGFEQRVKNIIKRLSFNGKNQIICGLFDNYILSLLEMYLKCEIYNVIIDKNISYKNLEIGVLQFPYDGKELTKNEQLFFETWDLLEKNKHKTILIENLNKIESMANFYKNDFINSKQIFKIDFSKFNIVYTI